MRILPGRPTLRTRATKAAVRAAFRAALGRRLPVTSGTLRVNGARRPVAIRRDRWGIPHIDAQNEADAWYGVGFCQGQDRTFQLELVLRVVRGTLAELIGPEGLPVDRLSRRIGFARSASAQLEALAPGLPESLEAYVRGVNEGGATGLRRRPHEFVLLRSVPTPWTAADVLGGAKLQSFLLASNWDVELTRLNMLIEDGPQAIEALDPTAHRWLPSAPAIDAARLREPLHALMADIGGLLHVLSSGALSNAWAVAPSRTASGRALLANDPHLAPGLPPPWYLVHVRTPEWSVAGAGFAGGPGIASGHNGRIAWGVTAGLIDNTDLYYEEVGADGQSVREGEAYVPCELLRERIAVRGAPDIEEDVLVTSRGPVIGGDVSPGGIAFSMAATWLQPAPAEGLLRLHYARDFGEFREALARWPLLPLTFAYADESGAIGLCAAGQAPRRGTGLGAVPLPGWDPDNGWSDAAVDAAPPAAENPATGFVATANGPPPNNDADPFLGIDWLDTYRTRRIEERLNERHDWDADASAALQMDTTSIVWHELQPVLRTLAPSDADARIALDLLKASDGDVRAESAAASVFEFFLSEMVGRVVATKAPRSAVARPGPGGGMFRPQGAFAYRWMHHLVRLLIEQPRGWFARPSPEEMADALAAAVRRLRDRHGGPPKSWAWGEARPLVLPHPLGRRKPLDLIFNLGPLPWGGDSNTISQAGTSMTNPAGLPGAIASLRMVVEMGAWDDARFVLPGGQSGNPLSPHYADQLSLWREGGGVPIAWSGPAVGKGTRRTLRLVPRRRRRDA